MNWRVPWGRLTKTATAVAVFFCSVAPGICAGLCEAKICCPATAAHSCCTHESESPTYKVAEPDKLCCVSMAAHHSPDAVVAKPATSVNFAVAILATAISIWLPTALPSAPFAIEDSRGPPGPPLVQHLGRGPPMI